MKFIVSYIATLVAVFIAAEESEIAKIFRDAKIVPDIMTVAPANVLKITYANDLIAHAGNELTPTQAYNEPQLEWDADVDAYYTLIMITPDPIEPIWGEFLRWSVVNVPGMSVGKGQIICPYLGPTPPQGRGKARYVFSVFKQPKVLTFEEPTLNSSSIAGHINFSTMKFAEKYDLGVPVAGDYFVAEWDESVNAMLQQLAYSV